MNNHRERFLQRRSKKYKDGTTTDGIYVLKLEFGNYRIEKVLWREFEQIFGGQTAFYKNRIV